MPPKSRSGKGSPKKSSSQDGSKKLDRSGEKKKRKGNKDRKFSYFIYKVLKQVHPEDVGMSSKGMAVFNDLMNDIFERLAYEAAKLAQLKQKRFHLKFATLGSREIQAAVRLVITGELGKHAVSEGTKAVAMFHASKQK